MNQVFCNNFTTEMFTENNKSLNPLDNLYNFLKSWNRAIGEKLQPPKQVDILISKNQAL